MSSLAEWKAIVGANDDEKLNSLAEEMVSSIDFIILVDKSTPPIPHAHTRCNPLTILRHGGLQQMGGPIAVSPIEGQYLSQSLT